MRPPDHMLAWLSFDEFARLVIAHEDICLMRVARQVETDEEATKPTEPARSPFAA